MIRPRLGVAGSEVSLRARTRALLFLLAVACTSLLVAAETWLVGTISSLETPWLGRWLLALDADDPQLQHRLGQAYEDVDPGESLRHLRRATQLCPASRLYWSDLESACESMGDTQCADQARERLLQLCPMVPSYHWLVADSCLRRNRLDIALEQFRRLLELDPNYALATWSSLQTVLEPEPVFEKVLGKSRNAKLKVGYVNFLSDQVDNDTAYRIWRRVAADSPSFPFSYAAPYLERLIGLGRIEEAVNVWQDLERLGIVKSSERNENNNLVFNGDFEQVPLNAGFDWRTGPTTYLALDFSAPGAYHGAHCLRVHFTVSRNDEYEPVYQIVPVLPRHAYRLEAFVRSEDITSDSGPCLRVSDTQPAGFPDAVSQTTVGTMPWHPVRLSFSTGPRTRAVRLSFWRPRSRVFPTEISGTSWLDAVSLHGTDCAVVGNVADGARRAHLRF
jgi:tetratricopeptide (TPR) repeat protein